MLVSNSAFTTRFAPFPDRPNHPLSVCPTGRTHRLPVCYVIRHLLACAFLNTSSEWGYVAIWNSKDLLRRNMRSRPFGGRILSHGFQIIYRSVPFGWCLHPAQASMWRHQQAEVCAQARLYGNTGGYENDRASAKRLVRCRTRHKLDTNFRK